MICRKSAPSLSYLPVFLTMSELFYSDMVHFSGSHGALKEKGAPGEKPRALAAPLRASNLQVCSHTTLSPYKKPALTCVNTGLTCMLCEASSAQPARAACSQAALTRSARRRPWRHVQRTAAPARERSRQRPEPHGRCARPRQDGFRLRSEALQSHGPSRHNHRSCAQG